MRAIFTCHFADFARFCGRGGDDVGGGEKVARMGRRRIWAASAWAILTAILGLPNARAVGWDSDDFIVLGAPNFSQYIGVFDHDWTFKGYLDSNFLGVRGMDFDAQGRLVAVSYINPEVRV